MPICLCCFINAAPTGFSHTQRLQQLCEACLTHYGNASRIQTAHLRMTNEMRGHHAKALEKLDAKLSEANLDNRRLRENIETLANAIASDYSERLIGDVQRIVEEQVVSQIKSEARGAQRSRDRVMGAVWRMTELHNETVRGCSCGKRVNDCKELRALEFIRGDFNRWEARQIDLDKQGKHHGLPLDHPRGRAFRGHEWDWKGLPSTVLETDRRRTA